jgi:hypothetical protein
LLDILRLPSNSTRRLALDLMMQHLYSNNFEILSTELWGVQTNATPR